MKITREATWRAKFISWVTTSMVMPRAARSRITVEHLGDQFGVERAGRLVEQHRLRVHRQRAGDGGALLLAARELLGIGVGLVGEADLRQQLRARAARRRARAAQHMDRRLDDVAASPSDAGTG